MKRSLQTLALLTALFLFTRLAIADPTNACAGLEAQFKPRKAPASGKLFLKPGDRLAICGDSITEQKMYSRIIETYLTVCAPELGVTVRQFGWSGEKIPGFLHRMTNDCLRFKPTVATTCYGMNDHEYRPYEEWIGDIYRTNTEAVLAAFGSHGARVVLGSPGCVGKLPPWSKATNSTKDDLNLNLCGLRNIDVQIAEKEKVRFADVFWPMLEADCAAVMTHGTNFAVAGKDGVHPDWAGSTIMAYAFLRALGVDGALGKFTVDLESKKAKVSAGHELVSYEAGELVIQSARFPFILGAGDPANDNNIYAGSLLVPFNEDLNRFILVVKGGRAKVYAVTWGGQTNTFSASQLAKGVNLAVAFRAENPFTLPFRRVDEAVAAKQNYETRQIKELFRTQEAKTDMEAVVAKSELDRDALAGAIKAAYAPVTHTIGIMAVE